MTASALNRHERRLYLEALELAQRITRNALIDVDELRQDAMDKGDWRDNATVACVLEARRQQCLNLLTMLRHVQVDIGAGRMTLPALTPDEQENIDRIY